MAVDTVTAGVLKPDTPEERIAALEQRAIVIEGSVREVQHNLKVESEARGSRVRLRLGGEHGRQPLGHTVGLERLEQRRVAVRPPFTQSLARRAQRAVSSALSIVRHTASHDRSRFSNTHTSRPVARYRPPVRSYVIS